MASYKVSGNQTKRSADCVGPLEERPGKIPQVDVQASIIELTISYATSGEDFAKLKMSIDSSVSDLKCALQEHAEPGKVVQGLFKGDGLLQESQSLEANGLTDGAKVKAIVGKPVLYVVDPSDDLELFGSDDEGEEEIQDISEAPEVARDVAKAMMAAAPSLSEMEGIVATDCVREGAYVVVIAHPGNNAKQACLQTLKTPREICNVCDDYDENDPEVPPVWRCATFEDKDWSKHLNTGFNNSATDGDSQESDDNGYRPQLLAITKIMSERLDKHFQFGFDDTLVVAPMFFGGFASDGNIVGVLTRRAWG